MSTYIVAFEVNDETRKEKLKDNLKAYGTYCPINDNCWAIRSEDTPIQIRDHLDESLVSSDRIFVMRSGTYSAWRNTYGKKNSDWLQEHL